MVILAAAAITHPVWASAARANVGAVLAARFVMAGDSRSGARSLHWLQPLQQERSGHRSALLLAHVLLRSGQTRQAEQIVSEYLAFDASPLAWNLQAVIFQSEGREDDAIRAWEKADVPQKVIRARWTRATALWTTQPSEARDDFYAVARLAEELRNAYWQAEGWRMVCATYRMERNWSEALYACDRSLQVVPELHMALAEKGYTLLLSGYGDRQEGLKYLRRASEIDPGNTYYRNLIERFDVR